MSTGRPPTPLPAPSTPQEFSRQCHPACIACRSSADGGLGLRFAYHVDGSVEASLAPGPEWQGYPDRLHGGIIMTLLDAAMTHCLFARMQRGYTAKFSARFHHPVTLDGALILRAWVLEARPPVYALQSELRQGPRRCASATAHFFEPPIA